jgi:hypothetical protein
MSSQRSDVVEGLPVRHDHENPQTIEMVNSQRLVEVKAVHKGPKNDKTVASEESEEVYYSEYTSSEDEDKYIKRKSTIGRADMKRMKTMSA